MWHFQTISCGNRDFAPTEECGDGNAISGEGCSEACEVEDRVSFHGEAQGGDVTLTVGGGVSVSPRSGSSASCCWWWGSRRVRIACRSSGSAGQAHNAPPDRGLTVRVATPAPAGSTPRGGATARLERCPIYCYFHTKTMSFL